MLLSYPMELMNTNFQNYLRTELSQRCEKNPLYSLRAFSLALGISPGVLSAIINGRRPLTLKKAIQLTERLEMDPAEQKVFLESVQEEISRRKGKITKITKKTNPLDLEIYKLISDWYYITILEMTNLPYFKESPQWIAGQLGISATEAKLALDSLEKYGLLERVDGRLKANKEQLRLPDMYTVTSAARRKKQKQIRQKAIESIENDSIETRCMTSMTMCIDPDLLPEARKMIEEFNENLRHYLESKSKKQVYVLEVGLFPIQKGIQNKEQNNV